jgi:NAD(P)-dependent dehydrogenase (short-subunit alcohol dehydrogenase family)
MSPQLLGKSVIVTGATSGIGRAIAIRMYAEGAHVLITGRHDERGQALARALGDRAVFIARDLTLPGAPEAVVDHALRRFNALDVLVNNAAVDHTGELTGTPLSEIRNTFETNVFAGIRMLQASALAMEENGGSIVNITSRLATVGVPTMAVYSASKGAMRAFTRAAAVELAPRGIRVNDVAPGMTKTPLYDAWLVRQANPAQANQDVAAAVPLGRLANPDDVASAVVYLASDQAKYITGATIPVDGGYTAT